MTAVNYLWNPINDNIVEEFDDAGNTIAEYTTEPDQFGDVISQYRDGQESFYHTDGQGSTLALTNSNGDVTDTYAYSAFGEVTAHAGSTVNPFQYIGQKGYYRDAETGEYEVRRRLFQSVSGRWLTVDPVFDLFLMVSHNDVTGSVFSSDAYLYVTNRPTAATDPSGLDPCTPADWVTANLDCAKYAQPSPLHTSYKAVKCDVTVTESTIGNVVTVYRKVTWLCKCQQRLFCTAKEKYALNWAVSEACHSSLGRGTACLARMTDAELTNNAGKFAMCAAARRRINTECFLGGDPGHKEAHDNAFRAAWNCLSILAERHRAPPSQPRPGRPIFGPSPPP